MSGDFPSNISRLSDSWKNSSRNICELAESRIEDHLSKIDALEDKSQATNLTLSGLAEDVGVELALKQQECLYSISLYLKNRPDLEVRTGKNGGIHRPIPA